MTMDGKMKRETVENDSSAPMVFFVTSSVTSSSSLSFLDISLSLALSLHLFLPPSFLLTLTLTLSLSHSLSLSPALFFHPSRAKKINLMATSWLPMKMRWSTGTDRS